jgi:hypothetical protein
VGVDAYTTEGTDGVLLVEGEGAVTGTGKLVPDGSGVVIVPASVASQVAGTPVILQDGTAAIDTSGSSIAVRGPLTIDDTATSSSSIKSDELGNKTLYVVGNVTVSDAIAGAPAINVLGNATVSTDAQTTAIVWNISGNLTANKAPTTGALRVKGNATFAEAVSSLAAAIEIGGNAEFEDTVTSTTGTLTVDGNATFAKAVDFGKDATFGGTAAFSDNLTLTAAPATFNGNVSVANGKKIVMTTDDSIITLGPGVVLGLPSGEAPSVYGSVIANNDANNVTLTPETGTQLAFSTSRTITQGATGNNAHGITIGGKAGLPAGATYTVASEENKVGTLTIDTDAELVIAAGVLAGAESLAQLVLTGAAGENGASLAGAGSVKAGATTITGGASGSWQVVGAGTVTISQDAITSNAATAMLTGTTDNSAAITVEGGNLTVIGKIDVATKGTVTLKANSGGTAGSLLLKGGAIPGNLTTGATTNDVAIGTATNENFELYATTTDTKKALVTKADGTALASDTGIVVQGTADSSSGVALGNIGGGDEAGTKDVLITSDVTATNALVIVQSDALKVKVPNT